MGGLPYSQVSTISEDVMLTYIIEISTRDKITESVTHICDTSST